MSPSSARTILVSALGCATLSHALHAQTSNVVVDKADKSIAFSANPPGEAQSTVVAPGLKSQCSAGRFVFTNDQLRPPTAGAVRLRDLTGSNATITLSTFGLIPLAAATFFFGTNDHDVVVMPNGDVILVWGVHLALPLNPKPAWFDVTTFNPTNPSTFGPGVRRGSMVWKSVDCGQTFQYMATLDPATIADGSCALPQGSPPWYKNGGSDGQLVIVDAKANRLVFMFPCMGNKQDASKRTFSLSSEKLAKTMVMTSADVGATWTFVGWDRAAGWRYQVVPVQPDLLATITGSNMYLGKKSANGSYQFDATPTIPAKPQGGWTGAWISGNPLISGATKVISANVLASTVMTRAPDNKNQLLVVFYDTIRGSDNKLVRGYRVQYYDVATKQFAELDPIEPINRTTNSFVMHLVAVDAGTGPILLYWTDVDAVNKRAITRGRLVMSASQASNDFPLSKKLVSTDPTEQPTISSTRYFSLGNSSYWYGDYQTAAGYLPKAQIVNALKVHYFPMWIEPDKTVRYTHVEATQNPTTNEIGVRKRIPKWHPSIPPVEAAKRKIVEPEMRDLDRNGPRVAVPIPAQPTRKN